MDRFTQDCEHILLAPKNVPGGKMTYSLTQGETKSKIGKGRMGRLLPSRLKRKDINDRIIFDCRRESPQNWAHFLNMHLPIFFHISERLSLQWDEVLLVLPANTPTYITKAAVLFGLETLLTDETLIGTYVDYEIDPWTSMRKSRVDWVSTDAVSNVVDAICDTGAPMPPKVFLARRNTRAIQNQTEVEEFLSSLGYVTIYPEDLTVSDQFRLFREAEEMVAVHGAGLAPLLFQKRNSNLKRLVEIMPVGHMTEVFHVIAQQVGCDWIGARGRIKSTYVPKIYGDMNVFSEYSLDDFEVDIRSLKEAITLIRNPSEDRNARAQM
ncbi:glycosyltransferase family 61 protein [Cognatiyoonia sediminum]|uniref:glycosyltransferase family 61 protein n=1 Tax=Cognatiyoonia sediminum TaxID=1508389 RepID=UPI0013F4C23D|nr:glycosyltransferase family 61 protein [Cognatiyoonia sediminum]